MTYCISKYCPGCGLYARCRCRSIEADHDAHYEASYRAGYEACCDGYDERPMTEWIYRTGHRSVRCPETGRTVHLMTPLRFAELTWRRFNRTAHDYRRWFERTYGHDLEAYLAGYDDAGAGLPSTTDDPDRHALAAAALEAYAPEPDLYEDGPLGPWPAPVEAELELSF